MLQILDTNREPVSFPLLLGSFTDKEAPYQRFFIYNPDALSYEDTTLKIEKISDQSYPAWSLAEDFAGRPAAFQDYLSELKYHIPAYSWTPFWLKFSPGKSLAPDGLQEVNLRITAEATA